MSRQKELYAYSKGIQQIEFVGKKNDTDGENTDGTHSMLASTIFKKSKETRLIFSQGNVTAL